jgi:predicted site-specific integrase-resolvase
MSLVAVPYLRVSTDDKGQDPVRQMEVIAPWAAREGIELLAAVIDEGTSASKTNPFERERFLRVFPRLDLRRERSLSLERFRLRFLRVGFQRLARDDLFRKLGLVLEARVAHAPHRARGGFRRGTNAIARAVA